MQYQCQDCKKIFIHTAKHTVTKPFSFNVKIGEAAANGEGDSIGEYGLQQGIDVTETQVCPYCHSFNYVEYEEPKPEIVSMKSVDINVVDDLLTQGYKVKESSTTKACMVKYAELAPKDAEAKSEDCVNPHEKIYRGCSPQCKEFKTCLNPDTVKAKAETEA